MSSDDIKQSEDVEIQITPPVETAVEENEPSESDLHPTLEPTQSQKARRLVSFNTIDRNETLSDEDKRFIKEFFTPSEKPVIGFEPTRSGKYVSEGWKVNKNIANWWFSLSQPLRLRVTVFLYVVSAILDFGFDITVMTLIYLYDRDSLYWVVILCILAIAAVNAVMWAYSLSDDQWSFAVSFAFLGLGSVAWGIYLLTFGFGPIYYHYPESQFGRFDQLRYQESGVESVLSAYAQVSILVAGVGRFDLTFISLMISVAVYTYTRVARLNILNRELYEPFGQVFLGLWIASDVCFSALSFAMIINHETKWIYGIAGAVFLFIAGFLFFEEEAAFNSVEKVLSRGSNTMKSIRDFRISKSLFFLATNLPVYIIDVSSSQFTRRWPCMLMMILRFCVNIAFGWWGMTDELFYVYMAALFARLIFNGLLYGWYWPFYKIIHIVNETHTFHAEYQNMFTDAQKETLKALCKQSHRARPNNMAYHLMSARLVDWVHEPGKPLAFQKDNDLKVAFEGCRGRKPYYLVQKMNMCGKELIPVEEQVLTLKMILGREYNQPDAISNVIDLRYKCWSEEMFEERVKFLLDVAPKYQDIYIQLATLCVRNGNPSRAKEFYTDCLEIEKTSRGHAMSLAHYNLGHILMSEYQQFEEAIAQFHKSIQINPRRANTHSNLGFSLAMLGFANSNIQQLKDARGFYNEALRLDPHGIITRKSLGYLLAYLGEVASKDNDNDQALELWKESLSHFEIVLKENVEDYSAAKDPLHRAHLKKVEEAKKIAAKSRKRLTKAIRRIDSTDLQVCTWDQVVAIGKLRNICRSGWFVASKNWDNSINEYDQGWYTRSSAPDDFCGGLKGTQFWSRADGFSGVHCCTPSYINSGYRVINTYVEPNAYSFEAAAAYCASLNSGIQDSTVYGVCTAPQLQTITQIEKPNICASSWLIDVNGSPTCGWYQGVPLNGEWSTSCGSANSFNSWGSPVRGAHCCADYVLEREINPYGVMPITKAYVDGYSTRSAAASACISYGYDGLCSQAQQAHIEEDPDTYGEVPCLVGWVSDESLQPGYWSNCGIQNAWNDAWQPSSPIAHCCMSSVPEKDLTPPAYGILPASGAYFDGFTTQEMATSKCVASGYAGLCSRGQQAYVTENPDIYGEIKCKVGWVSDYANPGYWSHCGLQDTWNDDWRPNPPSGPVAHCCQSDVPEIAITPNPYMNGDWDYSYSTMEDAGAQCTGDYSLCSPQQIMLIATEGVTYNGVYQISTSICRIGWMDDGRKGWYQGDEGVCGVVGWNYFDQSSVATYHCCLPFEAYATLPTVSPSTLPTTIPALPVFLKATDAYAFENEEQALAACKTISVEYSLCADFEITTAALNGVAGVGADWLGIDPQLGLCHCAWTDSLRSIEYLYGWYAHQDSCAGDGWVSWRRGSSESSSGYLAGAYCCYVPAFDGYLPEPDEVLPSHKASPADCSAIDFSIDGFGGVKFCSWKGTTYMSGHDMCISSDSNDLNGLIDNVWKEEYYFSKCQDPSRTWDEAFNDQLWITTELHEELKEQVDVLQAETNANINSWNQDVRDSVEKKLPGMSQSLREQMQAILDKMPGNSND